MQKMNNTYEAPSFKFEEMSLFEKVADKCWGYARAWFDANDNKIIEPGEEVNLKDLGLREKGCQGNAARTALTEAWGSIEGVSDEVLKAAVATTNDSDYVKGFSS